MRIFTRIRAALLAMFVCIFLTGLTQDVLAQRIVPVEPGVGTLNRAIDGDTTDTGERVDLNTIYQLERGGFYLLEGTIETRFPLTVMAAEGEGPRPILQPGVVAGGESSRPFTPRDDLYIKGLYVTNLDELGGINTRIIRFRADSAHLTIDDCHLDVDAQSGIRLDNDWNVIRITNSVISNIGRASSMNNGRVIDTRGNNVDTIEFVGNTIYNVTSRVIRDGGGFIKRLLFNHNTVMNVAQFTMTPGEVQSATITDNLFVNPAFLGQSDSTFADNEIIGIDSLQPDREGVQTLNIAHNHFYLDPAISAVYDVGASGEPVRTTRLFDPLSPAAPFADDPSNVVAEMAFPFAAAPAGPVALVQEHWADPSTDSKPGFDMDQGGGGPDPTGTQLPFDFSYPDTEAAATASFTGQPLGDLGWWGLEIVTAAEEEELPSSFRLLGNYPNPFNPSTTITYELDRSAEVSATVFDAMGREVLNVDPETAPAGTGLLRLDASGLSSGVYMYQIHAVTANETLTQSGRLVLTK